MARRAPKDLETREKKRIPFEFVIDALADVEPYVKPFFGSYGVYVGEKIVLILRDKTSARADNGVWVATVKEHHASLRRDVPSLRSIRVFGPGETGWQNIPAQSARFEDDALEVCRRIVAGDVRIGKVPKRRTPKARKG